MVSPAPTSFAPISGATAAPTRFLRVLYADDLPELRELARLSLSRDGHELECVADGLMALNRIMTDPGFDLVITDHHMPTMNGLQLVKGLRNLNYPGKIIVFSSELSPTVALEYASMDVDRILPKPIYPSALRQVLLEMFGISRASAR